MTTGTGREEDQGPRRPPDDSEQAQLDRLVTSLEEVIDANEIGPWMTNPNQAFDGLKPMEVIERGEIDRIWLMIYHLRSGVAF